MGLTASPSIPAGQEAPKKLKPKLEGSNTPFDGVLVDRHTADDGSEYLWLTFGSGMVEEGGLIDAEFVLPPSKSGILHGTEM